MTLQQQIAALQDYITICGEDAFLFKGVKATDTLDHLLELNSLHLVLDEFENALRDIYRIVKGTGIE